MSELINNFEDNNSKILLVIVGKDLLEQTQQIDYIVAKSKQKGKVIFHLKTDIMDVKKSRTNIVRKIAS